MTSKKNKDKDKDPEYGLDSRYSSQKEFKSEATALMEARLARMKNLSGDQMIRAKLMQLKLKMEEYIKKPVCVEGERFSGFLKAYIDTIYTNRSSFAKDVDITPVSLSQVINGHRPPKDEFMLKLMIHSEKVFENIGKFRKEIWLLVYYYEKMCETMANQEKWRPRIEDLVKVSEPLPRYDQ